jgi:hypothetical protein
MKQQDGNSGWSSRCLRSPWRLDLATLTTFKIMKSIKQLLHCVGLNRAHRALLASFGVATVVALACGASATRTQAGERPRHHENDDEGWLRCIHAESQVAELDQLLADFHGAISYGGNIDALMSLWARGSSLTFNGTPHVGNDAVKAFFTSSGYFLNQWVSLAPEFKTTVTLHGDTAVMSTQCVATDISVTPFVVRGIVQVNATAAKQHDGKWLFTSMNNTSPAPL